MVLQKSGFTPSMSELRSVQVEPLQKWITLPEAHASSTTCWEGTKQGYNRLERLTVQFEEKKYFIISYESYKVFY